MSKAVQLLKRETIDPLSREPMVRDPPQIRLLKIEPVEAHDDAIRIHTAIADLHEIPIFDALSYVWGDQSVRLSIFVNGESFEVGSNLHAALRALRAQGKKSYFWIDAICINQCDNLEKNYQVPLMAQIYWKAGSVICWLGEASFDSNLAISSLRECQKDPSMVMIMALSEHSHPAWNAIQNLIRRPYWRRVWIIQENQLARQRLFLCGNEQIIGDHMFTALDALKLYVRLRKHMAIVPDRSTPTGHSAEEVSDFDYFSLRISHIMAESRQPGLTGIQLILLLNDLMIETSNFQATDSRDRLYGLLGLLPPDINQLVQLDYTKSTTAVFVDFALLTYEGRFEMIAQSGTGHDHSPRLCPDLPSWVPSYRRQFIEDKQLTFSQRHLGSSPSKSGHSSPPRWSRVPNTLNLRVSGTRTGNITSVSAPEISLGARMVTWVCHAATMRDGDHPCRNWRRAFYQTLILDQDRHITTSSGAQDGEEAVTSRNEMVLAERNTNIGLRKT
jgi:hypothetical protein